MSPRKDYPWWVGVDPSLRIAILGGLFAICVVVVAVLSR